MNHSLVPLDGSVLDFNTIPSFPRSGYYVDVMWRHLDGFVRTHIQDYKLDLNPDFQRGHVWTDEQRSRYLEYMLRGGEYGKDLYFNCLGWQREVRSTGPYEIVDGLQRLTAVRRFLAGEATAFGRTVDRFTGPMRDYLRFRWYVFELTRPQVLAFYLDLNSAGTPHAPAELARVRTLLAETERKASKK